MGNYKFDLDLSEGKSGETLVARILDGEGVIEVKRDWKVSITGNIAIEYRCRGRRSGISTSTAAWWAIVLDGEKYGHEVVIFIRRTRLLEITHDYYSRGSFVRGGDDNASEMVLIPVAELVKWKPLSVKPELI